jgi:hypothetical protein
MKPTGGDISKADIDRSRKIEVIVSKIVGGCSEEDFLQFECPVCRAGLSLAFHPNLTFAFFGANRTQFIWDGIRKSRTGFRGGTNTFAADGIPATRQLNCDAGGHPMKNIQINLHVCKMLQCFRTDPAEGTEIHRRLLEQDE